MYEFSKLVPSIIWLILSGIILTIGDIEFKSFSGNKLGSAFFLTLGTYTLGLFFMMLGFYSRNIAIASVITVIFNVTFFIIFTYFYFHEQLNTYQLLGIFLGLISITILEIA